ncbi:5'-3' exonuclease [Metabacillus fastidiosus]
MQMTINDFIFEKKEKTIGPCNALIVDGNNLLNRAYYATALNTSRLKTSPDGRYVNGVELFLKMLFRYKTEFNITHLAVMFDKGRGFRQNLFPNYKGTRDKQPEELKGQFPIIETMLHRAGIPVYSDEVYEADDLIASVAYQLQSNMKVYVLSNDKDLLQIVSDQIIQICRDKKVDILFDAEKFKEKYNGLDPIQIIDLKALSGDKSDNIPGIPGVGDTGALKMLHELRNLESIIENFSAYKEFNRYKKKIEEGQELGILSKKLATLVTDLPVINHSDDLLAKWDVEEIIRCCQELGLTTLIKEIRAEKYAI